MNILDQEDIVKGMPDELLIAQSQNPTSGIPQFLLVSEIQRREKVRANYQGNKEKMPTTTVVDQVLQQGIASINPMLDPLMNTAMGVPQQSMMPQQAMMTAAGGGMMPYRMATGRDTPSLYDMFGPSPADLTAKQVVAKYPELFELGVDESTGRPMSVFKGPSRRMDPRDLLASLLRTGKSGGVLNPEQAQELLQGINLLSKRVGSSMEDLISEQDLRTLRSASELASVETNKYGVPLTQFASGPAKEDASRITARQVTPELIQYAQAPNTADAGVPDSSVVEGEVKEFADAFPNMTKVYKNKQPLGVMLSDADGPDPVDKDRVKKLIDFSLFPKAVAAEQESLGVLQKDIDPTDPKINQAQLEGFLQATENRRLSRVGSDSQSAYDRAVSMANPEGGSIFSLFPNETKRQRAEERSAERERFNRKLREINQQTANRMLEERGLLPSNIDQAQAEKIAFLENQKDEKAGVFEPPTETPSEYIDDIIKKLTEKGKLGPSNEGQPKVGEAESGDNEEEIIELDKTSRLPGILGADPVLGGLALARLGAGIAQGDIGKGLIGATDVVLQERKLTKEEEKDKALMDLYKERAALAKRTDPNKVKGQDLSYYIKIVQNQQPVDPYTGEPKVLNYAEVIRQAQILQRLDTGDLDRDKAIGQLSMQDALGGGSQVSESFEDKRQRLQDEVAGLSP